MNLIDESKITLSPYCEASFEEFATRLGYNKRSLMTIIWLDREYRRDKLMGVEREKDDLLQEINKREETEFWLMVKNDVSTWICNTFNSLAEITPLLNVKDFSFIEGIAEQALLYTQTLGSNKDLTIELLLGYGKSINFICTKHGNTIRICYDFHFDLSIKELNLFLFRRLVKTEDGKEFEYLQGDEIQIGNNTISKEKYQLVELILGHSEEMKRETQYYAGEILDCEINAFAAFRFIILHEICHCFLNDTQNKISAEEEEIICDLYSLIIIKVGIIFNKYDLVETVMGVISFFYLHHINECYYERYNKFHKINAHLKNINYPSAVIRYDSFFRNLLIGNPIGIELYKTAWNRLNDSLFDYIFLVLARKGNCNFKYESSNFIITGIDGVALITYKNL